jgi:hypothetical protein
MPIQLRMMQPEDRLGGRNIHVAAGVAQDTEVPTKVQCSHGISVVRLEGVLERSNGLVTRDMRQQILRPQVVLGEDITNVPTQAARIIAKAVGLGVTLDPKLCINSRHQRSQMYRRISKRALDHTASTILHSSLLKMGLLTRSEYLVQFQ